MAQQKADQAEGALSEVMKQLKHEFNCSTLDQAKKELKRRKRQAADSKEKFDAALEKFEEDWPDESN